MQTRNRKRNAEPNQSQQIPQNQLPSSQPAHQPHHPAISNQSNNQQTHQQWNQVNSENENSLKDKLNKLYSDIKSVPSYSAKITEFLRQHDTHGPYQRISKRTFPRRRIISRFPFEYFMADLIEYPRSTTKRINRGYVYILILIDCFTKKIYVAPMKKKDKQHSALAFESIFKDFDQFPTNLVTDGGKEFFNSDVAKVFQNYGINHYKTPTRTRWKASMAERAIQTIKSRLQKYFKLSGKSIWLEVINQIANNYNATPHSSHKIAPQDVNDENRDEVYKRLYPDKDLTIICKLKKGYKVRVLREKTDFEKGYLQKWSDEIYTIKDIRQSGGTCWYILQDHTEKEVKGIWYYYQLNLVAKYVDKLGS